MISNRKAWNILDPNGPLQMEEGMVKWGAVENVDELEESPCCILGRKPRNDAWRLYLKIGGAPTM